MQNGVEAGSAATLADRRTGAFGALPMLGRCTATGCATIVFGRGSCVAHDPPRFAALISDTDAGHLFSRFIVEALENDELGFEAPAIVVCQSALAQSTAVGNVPIA